jgi:hypothetical protein
LSTSQAFPNPSHFCPSRCTSCVEMLNVHGQTPANNHSRRSNTVQGTSDGGDTQKHIRPIGRGHSSCWNNFRWVTLTGPISSRSKPGTGSNRQMLQSSPTRNIWKGNDMHSTFPAHVMPQLEVDKRVVANRCKVARVGATKEAIEAGFPAGILEVELEAVGLLCRY